MTTKEDDSGPFPKKITRIVGVIAALSLIGSFASLFLTGAKPQGSAGSDSTSSSALGHHAFLDLLRAVGLPVIVSRHDTAKRTDGASLLLLLEPLGTESGRSGPPLEDVIRDAKCPVLLVLPKWRLIAGSPPHLIDVERASQAVVEGILGGTGRRAHVAVPAVETEGWTKNDLGLLPEISEPQLVRAPDWDAIVARGDDFLVATHGIPPQSVAILADPDLVANHGLHRGNNARIALDLVARLRSGTGPVVLDETLHGLGVPDSIWVQLFRFPLALASLQAALAVVLLLWAGMRRFGAPERALPPFDPGTRFLTEHTARLLESARHHGEALVRYGALVAESAARELHSDAQRGSDVQSRLAHLESRRQTTDTLADLQQEAARLARTNGADARAALRHARKFRKWKQEIVDGPSVSPGVR